MLAKVLKDILLVEIDSIVVALPNTQPENWGAPGEGKLNRKIEKGSAYTFALKLTHNINSLKLHIKEIKFQISSRLEISGRLSIKK